MNNKISTENLTSTFQQELFEITDGKSHTDFRVYTNILELWDMLPKYDPYGSKQRYHRSLSVKDSIRKVPVKHPVHRQHLISDVDMFVNLELHITPARIEKRMREWVYVEDGNGKKIRKRIYILDEDGNYKTEALFVYPGLREDKIEECLKWLLSHGQGSFKSDQTGVTFSIRQLVNELKRNGSEYNLEEVKESLEVLSKSHCEIHGLDADGRRQSVMSSSFLPQLVMIDRDSWLNKRVENGQDLKHCYAQFHVAVTMSIQANQFRITHYDKHQQLNNLLSRFIHKILRTQFTNASTGNKPFTLSFNKLMAEYGREITSRHDINIRILNTALKDLKDNDVICGYDINEIVDPRDKRIKIDREIKLYPSNDFVTEMIESNTWHKKNRDLVSDHSNSKAISRKVTDLSNDARLTLKELREWGISNGKGLEILENYNLMVVRRILREARNKQDKGTLKKPAGFILKSLDEGWFADADYIPGSDTAGLASHSEITNVEPGMFGALSKNHQDRVKDLWRSWDESTRKTFNKHGIASPSVREKLGLID